MREKVICVDTRFHTQYFEGVDMMAPHARSHLSKPVVNVECGAKELVIYSSQGFQFNPLDSPEA